MISDMKGTLEYKGKKYSFAFSDEVLDLYPREDNNVSEFIPFQKFKRGKTIENIELCGLNTSGNSVVFEVSELCSSNNGYLSFEVYSVFEYDEYVYFFSKNVESKILKQKAEIRRMRFVGSDVDIFYP